MNRQLLVAESDESDSELIADLTCIGYLLEVSGRSYDLTITGSSSLRVAGFRPKRFHDVSLPSTTPAMKA